MNTAEPAVVQLPTVHDARGNLTITEGDKDIPFTIKRTYHLYDVPGGAERGGHGHRELQQFIIAMSGSFDVVLHDGFRERTFSLNRSNFGLYVPRMYWRVLNNFSSGAVCLVLASERFSEDDYYRDFDEFQAAARKYRPE